MSFIRTENVSYDYKRYTEEGEEESVQRALDHVDLEIAKGEFIAILGHNGSGKSTLARHINALLFPTEGTVWVGGYNTAGEDILKVRQTAGMVFQNPDNQIIATVVEEDVGFGPENIGVPTEEIWRRVDDALARVGMTAYREKSPNRLSGGQKQRVAIAGVVAMRPQCIVLDEATAMLDPDGRREVLKTIHELHQKEGVTVILITHYMEEATRADRIFVLDEGKLILSGTPREVFAQTKQLLAVRMELPQIVELAEELRAAGFALPEGILTREDLKEALLSLEAAKGV